MIKGLSIGLFSLCCYGLLPAQITGQFDLPQQLADETTRQNAITFVAASRAQRVPLLLDLMNDSPPNVDKHNLNVGLADASGALMVREAIPFLLRNITLRRNIIVDLRPWLKTPEVIKRSFPAVAALISIGPEASQAAMRAYGEAETPEQRLAMIFVVSQIRGVPEAKTFLSTAASWANLERYFSEEGMKMVNK